MLLTGCLLLSGMLCCYDCRAHTIPFCDRHNTVYLPYSHFVGISVTWLITVGDGRGGGCEIYRVYYELQFTKEAR
jgi:hypothetical protein